MTKRVMAALCLLSLPALAQHRVVELIEQKTLAAIAEFDEEFDGALGVAAIDLINGRVMQYHGDAVFAQASSIKIPILARMFEAAAEGKFRMDDRVTLTASDTAGGSGELRKKLELGPVTLTVRELMTAMIETSDNTATNKCIAMVGMESVNALMERHGLRDTRLRRVMMDSGAARAGRENISTPLEMARLAELIYRGQVVSEDAAREMIEIMALVKAAMRAAVPAETRVASKPGGVPGVHAETGIIYLERRPFALSVMSSALGPDAKNPVGEVTRIVLRHFERLASTNEYGHRLW
jgi:beta-lactamase class A